MRAVLTVLLAAGLFVVGPVPAGVQADEGRKADLVIDKVIYVLHCDVGVLHMAVQVRNIGRSAADRFPTVLRVNGVRLGALMQWSPGLDPGEIHKFHWNYSPFYGGQLFDQERADFHNQVRESDEVNNTDSHLTDFPPC